VKIEMTDAAYNEFISPIIYPDTYWPHNIGNPDVNNGVSALVYYGCENIPLSQVLDKVIDQSNSLVPNDVNLRFASGAVAGQYKRAVIVTVEDINRNIYALGFTPNEHVSWRNTRPHGICYVYAEKARKGPCEERLHTETGINPSDTYDADLFPFTPDELATALASTAAHEVGHTLGLVHGILHGSSGMHNLPTLHNGWIMNRLTPDMTKFGKHATIRHSWKPLNHSYLHFILPIVSEGGLP
jgi:hypothetical protein